MAGRDMQVSHFSGLCLVLLCLTLLITPAHGAEAGETINWFIYNLPPAAEPEQGKPGNGFVDQILKRIIKGWPEAKHKFVIGNPNRFWTDVAAGKPYCAMVLNSQKHQDLVDFIPVLLIPPPQLYVRADLLGRIPFNDNGEIRLPQLLQMHQLHGVLIAKRSYGAVVDKELAHRDPDASVAWLSVSGVGSNLPTMISHRRADWSIGFDFVLAYAKHQDPDLVNVVAVPIEGSVQPIEFGLACTDNDWGQRAIARARRIVSEPALISYARNLFEQHLTPETLLRYEARNEEFYRRLLPAKPSPPDLKR